MIDARWDESLGAVKEGWGKLVGWNEVKKGLGGDGTRMAAVTEGVTEGCRLDLGG